MPAGDRTGPMGNGPMTGRAAGLCTGNSMPGYANPAGGRGFFGAGRGRGRGGGRGWRNWFYATGVPFRARRNYPGFQPYGDPYYGQELRPEDEAGMLREQAEFMQKEINSINERIKELESHASKEKK